MYTSVAFGIKAGVAYHVFKPIVSCLLPSHGRRSRGRRWAIAPPPPNILPTLPPPSKKKNKEVKITTYKSVHSNNARIPSGHMTLEQR